MPLILWLFAYSAHSAEFKGLYYAEYPLLQVFE